eukprot:3956249-Pyramimonas_sp.AAC.1
MKPGSGQSLTGINIMLGFSNHRGRRRTGLPPRGRHRLRKGGNAPRRTRPRRAFGHAHARSNSAPIAPHSRRPDVNKTNLRPQGSPQGGGPPKQSRNQRNEIHVNVQNHVAQ